MPAGVRYLALLRGVNVGGKNLVRMADLRAAFEELGVDEVTTYIQSGNVLFRAPRQKREELAARLESSLSRRFGIELKVVLLTAAHLKEVIEGAPRGFGGDAHLCDVLFVRKPLTVGKTLSAIELREGVDSVWPGRGVLYFSRVAARASGSRISKFAGRPEYKNVTIRSWTTTKKLHALMASSA